jgi:hypothetical protein
MYVNTAIMVDGVASAEGRVINLRADEMQAGAVASSPNDPARAERPSLIPAHPNDGTDRRWRFKPGDTRALRRNIQHCTRVLLAILKLDGAGESGISSLVAAHFF